MEKLIPEDWERVHLMDKIYIDEDREAEILVGEGIRHEPLYADTLPVDWGECRIIIGEHESKELVGHTGEKGLPSSNVL